MGKKLAFMTIGVLYEPFGSPRVQGFVDRIPSAFAAADASDGFIARSVRNLDSYSRSWGEVVVPECLADYSDPLQLPATLSLWDDLESVAAFAYHGPHGEAMTKRREWFKPGDAPTYAAWWVEDEDKIDSADAARRLDHLHSHGSTPYAFNFSTPFDSEGNPCPLNQAKVKSKVTLNAGK